MIQHPLSKLGTILVAAPTFYKELEGHKRPSDSTINPARTAQQALQYCKRGVHGVVIGSSAAEGHLLRQDQLHSLSQACAIALDDQKPLPLLVLSTGQGTAGQVAERAHFAHVVGAHGLYAMPPYALEKNPEIHYRWYRELIENCYDRHRTVEHAKTALLLVHDPTCSYPEILGRLMKESLPIPIGVVIYNDEFPLYKKAEDISGQPVWMMTGREDSLLAALRQGVTGIISSGAGHPDTLLFIESVIQCFKEQDHRQAESYQNALRDQIKWLRGLTPNGSLEDALRKVSQPPLTPA